MKGKYLEGVESEAATLWEVSGYERLLIMPLHVGAADREGERERETLILPLNFSKTENLHGFQFPFQRAMGKWG